MWPFGDNGYKLQREKILHHLEKGESITALEAFEKYNIMRLASIIYVLKKRGYKIESITEQSGRVKYARYYMRNNKGH